MASDFSVNVGVLSIMVGARYGLERSKLYDLGVAAMLHDIGKKFLPEEIANGKWPLEGAEREAWKSHPKLGAEYLRTSYHFPAVVSAGVCLLPPQPANETAITPARDAATMLLTIFFIKTLLFLFILQL